MTCRASEKTKRESDMLTEARIDEIHGILYCYSDGLPIVLGLALLARISELRKLLQERKP